MLQRVLDFGGVPTPLSANLILETAKPVCDQQPHRLAFLLGTLPRVGGDSPVRHALAEDRRFDLNVLQQVWDFVEHWKKPKRSK